MPYGSITEFDLVEGSTEPPVAKVICVKSKWTDIDITIQ